LLERGVKTLHYSRVDDSNKLSSRISVHNDTNYKWVQKSGIFDVKFEILR